MNYYFDNDNPEISEHFARRNFDIRTKGGIFMDQKVTIDVLCIIAECILEYLKSNEEPFSINDIRSNKKSEELIVNLFKKPKINKAGREYDKFFSQPIKMLAYAGILTESKNSEGRGNVYEVANTNILKFIAIRDRNALIFITQHLKKVLTDSEIMPLFRSFLDAQSAKSFTKLKNGYIQYINKNTPKKTALEVSRIFTKVLNPLAFINESLGTRGGMLSESVITLDELHYNRQNWRDKLRDKSLTRAEAAKLFPKIKANKTRKYNVDKAKRKVKELHDVTEVHRFKTYKGRQVHHIFMESEFPMLADLIENLIILTPTQHLHRAHPGNKTRIVDDDYQIICLLSKLDSIEMNIEDNENDYSKNVFVYVLNTGFETDFFDTDMNFEEIKHRILQFKGKP